MTKIISEDSEEARLSKLLKLVLHDNIVFSGGNTLLRSKIEEVWNSKYSFIVFIDVIPDSRSTLYEYRNVFEFIKDKGYSNVWLIPIFCIEYCVINTFGNDTEEIQCVCTDKLYKRYYNLRGIGEPKTFERFCKKVLNSKMGICFTVDIKQSVIERNPYERLKGKFYVQDCRYCVNTKINRLARVNKAWCIISQLLGGSIIDSNIFDKLSGSDIESLRNQYIDIYNRVCEDYYHEGYIDKPIYLSKGDNWREEDKIGTALEMLAKML